MHLKPTVESRLRLAFALLRGHVSDEPAAVLLCHFAAEVALAAIAQQTGLAAASELSTNLPDA